MGNGAGSADCGWLIVDRDVVVYALGKVAPAALSVAMVAVFTRILSPQEYGLYAVFLAVASMSYAVAGQWLKLSTLRFLVSEGAEAGRGEVVGVVIAAAAALIVLAGVAVGLCLAALPQRMHGPVALVAGAFVGLIVFEVAREGARAQLRPALYGVASVARSGLWLAGGSILAHGLGLGAAGVVLGFVGANLVAGGMVALRALPRPTFPPSPLLVKRMLAYGGPLAITFALASVLHGIDRLFLWRLGFDDAVGPYAAGYDIVWGTVTALLVVVNLAAGPRVLRAYDREGVDSALHQIRGACHRLAIVGVPLALGVIVFADEAIAHLLDQEYVPVATMIAPFVAVAALIGGLRAFGTDLVFHMCKRTTLQWWVVGSALGVNIALNLLWIPKWGAFGAAGATLAAHAVGITVSLVAAMVLCGRSVGRVLSGLLQPVIAGTAMYTALAFAATFTDHESAWILHGIFGGVVYLTVLEGSLWVGRRGSVRARRGGSE
jgi:O-antigen/teichoic acid export membrane protein